MGGKTLAGEGPSATSAGYFFQRLFLHAALFFQNRSYDFVPLILPLTSVMDGGSSLNLYYLRDF